MKIFKIYQNWFFRNLILNVVILTIIYGCVYNEMNETSEKGIYLFWGICQAYFPTYIWVTFSNVVLIRKFFFRKKHQTFILLSLAYWISYYVFIKWYFAFFGMGKLMTLPTLMAVLNGTALYFLHTSIIKKISNDRKRIINFESELSFLKQQLNPHFLLNAMNNLYGESLSAPEKVPERILNLSDMLRYQIETTKKDFISLNEEVQFVKKYIDYHTFRNERLTITQKYDGFFEGIDIPPLFFLPLVENAVKFSGETSQPFITLGLNVSDRKLSFSIENNYLNVGSRLSGTGIGIKNLERRLEVCGLKHELMHKKEGDLFSIKLNIWELPTVA
jgi:sensor histidine kinase YesM